MSNEVNTIIKEKAKEILIDTVRALMDEPYGCSVEEIGMILSDVINKEELIRGLHAGETHEGVQRVEKEGA